MVSRVDRLVRGGDETSDVRLCMSLLIVREAVEVIDRVGKRQKSSEGNYVTTSGGCSPNTLNFYLYFVG